MGLVFTNIDGLAAICNLKTNRYYRWNFPVMPYADTEKYSHSIVHNSCKYAMLKVISKDTGQIEKIEISPLDYTGIDWVEDWAPGDPL
jgi:hypothetical protein